MRDTGNHSSAPHALPPPTRSRYWSLPALILAVASGGLLWWLLAAPVTPEPRPAAETAPIALEVPPFALIERSGRRVTNADLLGSVWVAGFVFTRCHGPCPLVTGVMARLRSELDPEVHVVTMTVDPEHDTPAVLAEYARRSAAPEKGWWFLTGEKEPVYRLLREGFRVGVEEDADPAKLPGERITHSTRLAVVDRHGRIRAYFEATDPASTASLKRKVAALLKEPR